MIKSKTIIKSLIAGILIISVFLPIERVMAQSSWGAGVSYEMRNSNPNNGFGLRLERNILSGLPIVDVNLRAHFSYFSEEVSSYRDAQVPADLDVYDFGVAATGGIGFGLLKPYAGVGLGSENFNAVQSDVEQLDISENSIYWNLYGGVSFPLVPVVKPFAEYRFTRLLGSEGFDYSHNSRVAIGILLKF